MVKKKLSGPQAIMVAGKPLIAGSSLTSCVLIFYRRGNTKKHKAPAEPPGIYSFIEMTFFCSLISSPAILSRARREISLLLSDLLQ